jgi:tRNA A37 methylthiotransferase MiaB
MAPLTIAYEYTYEFEPEDENEDYDEDVAFDAYKKQLENRNEVDAIIINTCYFDRLTLGNIKDLKVSAIIDDDTVITFDGVVEDFYNSFKEEDLQGLVFKTTEAIDTIKLISKLEEIDYCVHCTVQNITELNWYTVNGKTVLYVSVDAESG